MRKKSHYIERKAGRSLMHAARTARAIGRPFNIVVTISFWQLGIGIEDSVGLFEKIRNQNFDSWSRYKIPNIHGVLSPRNGSKTYAYAFENPNGKAHLHWMVHIQPNQKAAFRKLIRRAIERASGYDDAGHALLFQDLAETKDAEALKLYMGKGIEPHYAKTFCNIDPEECGVVFGRRCNVSQNIGPKVYLPLRDRYLAENPNRRRSNRRRWARSRAA